MKYNKWATAEAYRFPVFIKVLQGKGAGRDYPPLDEPGDRDAHGAITKQGYDALIDTAHEWVKSHDRGRYVAVINWNPRQTTKVTSAGVEGAVLQFPIPASDLKDTDMLHPTSAPGVVPVVPQSSIVDASSIDPIDGEWIEIDTRENSTMASTWTERLCLLRAPTGFEIAICINGAVGEDPGPSTYDDDDENDEPREWRLPAFHEGHLVAMTEDGLLCGPLLVSSDDASVFLPEIGRAQVKAAIERLGWTSSDETVLAAIRASEQKSEVSTLGAGLIDAYKATTYRVKAEDETFDLRIGELSHSLGALYERAKHDTATFVTAWNPLGEPLAHADNAQRHAELLDDVIGLSLPYFDGEGCGDHGDWEPEKSLLVLGLTYEQALHLGRHHEQNAIVWALFDAVPKLVLLR